MFRKIIYAVCILLIFLAGWVIKGFFNKPQGVPFMPKSTDKTLEKYTIANLSKTQIQPGILNIKNVIKEEKTYSSYLFEFAFNPNFDMNLTKKTTGQINIPKELNKFPLILMLRGYIDQKRYITGDGTRNAAAFFAKEGFITIAPDFLGYGGSDEDAQNIFEARFQAYVATLSLIKSLDQIGAWDNENIFIWGHSNGGQIALTILELTEANYATALWAPVSKPFPYSVLYYTDASEDRGKLIRSELAKFEKDYDPDHYSLDLYLDKIRAPLQIHQGGNDAAVPQSWSDNLVFSLKKLKKDITYRVYPNADHNMRPDWNKVVSTDLTFFKKYLKQ